MTSTESRNVRLDQALYALRLERDRQAEEAQPRRERKSGPARLPALRCPDRTTRVESGSLQS